VFAVVLVTVALTRVGDDLVVIRTQAPTELTRIILILVDLEFGLFTLANEPRSASWYQGLLFFRLGRWSTVFPKVRLPRIRNEPVKRSLVGGAD
jgi:hypothetical protein